MQGIFSEVRSSEIVGKTHELMSSAGRRKIVGELSAKMLLTSLTEKILVSTSREFSSGTSVTEMNSLLAEFLSVIASTKVSELSSSSLEMSGGDSSMVGRMLEFISIEESFGTSVEFCSVEGTGPEKILLAGTETGPEILTGTETGPEILTSAGNMMLRLSGAE